MTANALALRMVELRLQRQAQLDDVAVWTRRTAARPFDIHATQLRAIRQLTEVGAKKQQALLDMPPGVAALGTFVAAFDQHFAKAQRLWAYFRDKLDQRLNEGLQSALWIADTVAFDCYNYALGEAVIAGVLQPHAVREPPLTFLDDAPTAAAWRRGDRPHDGHNYALGSATLPLPVLSLPRASLSHTWWLPILAHEVGHALEADFRSRPALDAALVAALPVTRRQHWLRWHGEILADLLAIQMIGPPFIDALLTLLIVPPANTILLDPHDEHPFPWLRMRICLAHARTLLPAVEPTLNAHLADLQARWDAFCPDAPADAADWDAEIGAVLSTLMDTPLVAGGPGYRVLFPFRFHHWSTARETQAYLLTGLNRPAFVTPRHVVGAARLAANAAFSDPVLLRSVSDRALQLVRDFAPSGTRGQFDSPAHQAFVESFYERAP